MHKRDCFWSGVFWFVCIELNRQGGLSDISYTITALQFVLQEQSCKKWSLWSQWKKKIHTNCVLNLTNSGQVWLIKQIFCCTNHNSCNKYKRCVMRRKITKKALHHHLLHCGMLLCQWSLLEKLHNDSKLSQMLFIVFFPQSILVLLHSSWVLVSLCILTKFIVRRNRMTETNKCTHGTDHILCG